MLEDIGMMRALPNMRVLVPADYRAAKAAIRIAATTPGPVYVRMGRHKVPEVYDESFVGGLPYAGVLREGTDVTILACGVEVAQSLAAADILAKSGISAEVIDVFSVLAILASAEKRLYLCRGHRRLGELRYLRSRRRASRALSRRHSAGRGVRSGRPTSAYQVRVTS